MNVGCSTVGFRTGTKTYAGPCIVTKGNHARMAARDGLLGIYVSSHILSIQWERTMLQEIIIRIT